MNNIDRNKHNKYVVGWTPTIPLLDTTPSGVSTSTTIIVGGGGSGSGTGLTDELAKKLESIEYGALVNQNAYSYLSLSDNTNTIIQAARLLEDTANLSIIGKQGIETSLVCELKLPETTITSTGLNTGVYKVSYGKVINKIETPSEDPEGEPTITEEITWPLIITYVSGELLLTTSFDTIKLINLGVETTLTDYLIETNETGITSITKDQSNLIFDQIKFTLTTTPEATEEIPEPESITTEVLVLNAVVYNYCTYYISNTGDGYWKLDENGNLYTDYNAYSTKELSAYGLGEGTGEAGGGASYLYELGDVDKESASSPINGGILQYNSTTHLWEVTDGSNINPDLKDYAKVEWVNDLIEALIGGAPADLDTLGEIATRLLSLEILLEWFEWDDTNQAIKALFNLYGVGEISAYGYRAGGGETGGKSYLNELEDVDITNLLNQGILQYNATTKMWEVTDGSSIRPDLSGYAETTWVTTQINNAVTNLIDGAPADLNTLGKIATVIEELQLFLDWFSFVDGRIRANYNFWGVGEVSAYGVGEGSSSSGKDYLHELEDVLLGDNLASGQLLQYNGTYWVNIDKDEVGLNETELANYLTLNNYLQQGDVTWSNLPGKPSTFATTVRLINDLNSSWDSLLLNSPTDYVTRWPEFSEVTDKPTTLAGYGITDAYTKTEADDRYVNITGDTMTGNLTLPALIANDYIRIGSAARLEYDSANNAIRVTNASGGVVNFYATGEVSAYGMGSGSTISGYLNDLEDVTISNVITGLALIYNGSLWVNQTIQQGLDEDALEDYLNDNGYRPSNTTVNEGVAGRLAYYVNATTIDDYSSTIGSSTRLWFLSSGTPTNSTSTIGNNYTPVFLSSGTITASSLEFMVDRGVLGDNWTNWNSALTAGMYSLVEWGTNGPSSAGYQYGTVAIFKSGTSAYGGAVSLLYMPHADAKAGVYAAWRTTYGASSSRWTGWHYLLDTGNYANFLDDRYAKKTDNVYSATKLQTARTLWGQSFDGTANVSGSLSNTGTITPSSNNAYALGSSSLRYGTVYANNGDFGNVVTAYEFHANNANMLQYDVFTNKKVLSYGWDSTMADYITINIPGNTKHNHKMELMSGGIGGLRVTGNFVATGYVNASNYLQVGSARLYYDSSAEALYVQKSDGSTCSFYATGEVSAYGDGSGSASITATDLNVLDVRDDTIYPDDYDMGFRVMFRSNGTDGLSNSKVGGSFHAVIQINKWLDSSGGRVHLMAFGDNNTIWTRVSNSSCTGWDEWNELSALSGLSDVSLSSPSNGQSLVYRNGLWRNETVSGGGSSSVAWSDITGKPSWIGSSKPTYTAAEVGALTQTAADIRYVKKSGDTMTGQLTVSTNTLGTQLVINRGDSINLPSVTYKNNAGILGRIGVGGRGNGSSYQQPCFSRGTSTELYQIWHEDNDGSGSGLDADLLDGTHKSGLFTGLTYSGNRLSATIGGTTKSVTIQAGSSGGFQTSGEVTGNWNNYTTTGAYRAYTDIGSFNGANAPSTSYGYYGMLLVFKNGETILQVFIAQHKENRMQLRMSYNWGSSWSGWKVTD